MMQKLLKSQVIELLSDIRREVVKYWLPLLVGSSAVSAYLADLLNIASISLPLWVAIALAAMLSLLTNLAVARAYKYPKKPFLFEETEFKWKVTEHSKNTFSVDGIPYCKDHNLQLIQTEKMQYICPELLCSQCKSRVLEWDDLKLLLSIAKSKIDFHIGKYETKI